MRYRVVSDDVFPPAWSAAGGRVRRRYAAPDFAAAFAFVERVAAEAGRLDHHPDVWFGWGYVEISCTTHATGGLTDADLALVRAIDALGVP